MARWITFIDIWAVAAVLGVFFIQQCTSQTGVNVFRITVPQNKTEYKYAWMTTDTPSLVMRVKACSEAFIALAREPSDYSQRMYLISITTEKITMLKREQKRPDEELGTADTPDDFLGCKTWRNMWVGWDGYNMTFGQGQNIGKDVILAVDDSETGFPVTAVSVSSSENSDKGAIWEIRRDYVRAIFVWTNPETASNDIWITENDRGYVIFGVRTCKQAMLYLSEGFGTIGNAFRLVLGASNNRISKILKGDKTIAKADTPDLLDCEETRYIWISWQNGVIEVGRGMRVRDRMFMTSPPKQQTQNLTALTILSQADDAYWQFRSLEENSFLLLSEAGTAREDEHIISVSRSSTFVFRLRACKNAILELRKTEFMDVDEAFAFVRITIGTDGNKATLISYIDKDGNTVNEDTLTTPKILNCKFLRPFWFSWKGKYFRLGTGSKPFEDEIDSVEIRNFPILVEKLHLASSDKKNPVEWQMGQSQGTALQIRTQPAFYHTQAWYTVGDTNNLIFQIQTGRAARLLLATYLGNLVVDNYEVVIQNEEGVSLIRKSSSSENCVQVTVDELLSDTESRFFWMSWYFGHIEVGQGRAVGEAHLMTCDDRVYPYEVNAVSFASDQKATWTLSEREGPRFLIHTNSESDEDNYKAFWLGTHRKIIPFHVMSRDPVTIILTRVPGLIQDGDIEIYLGITDNTEIGMAIHNDPGSMRKNHSFDVLNYYTFREFWILWYNDTLLVGRGSVWYENAVLVETLDVPIAATGIVLNSNDQATWQIDPELGTVLWKRTRAQYLHNELLKTFSAQKSFLFRVKAPDDARIRLSPNNGADELAVEIAIGYEANQKTVIRNSTNAIIASAESDSVLSKDELRFFWASWNSGLVKVGRGRLAGADVLVEARVPTKFETFSIGTANNAGEWEISNVLSNTYHVKTPSIEGPKRFDVLLMHTSLNIFQFKVLTCSSAHIAFYASSSLSPASLDPGKHVFELSITAKDIVLYRLLDTNELAEVARSKTSEPVLRCGQSELFWIDWEGGLLRVGQNIWPNRILLEFQSSLAYGINVLSLAGGADRIPTATQWEIPPTAIDELRYHSIGKRDYDQIWMTLTDRDVITFELQACGNVSIILSEVPGVTKMRTYEIDIGNGGTDSKEVVIRKNGEYRASALFGEFVSCFTSRHFWVRWRDHVIAVGQGSMFGPDGLLHWEDDSDDKLTVTAVSASSYGGTKATFGFYKLQENLFEFVSADTKDEVGSYTPAWLPPAIMTEKLTFTVVACRNARLLLQRDPYDLETHTYEVVLGTIDSDTGTEYCALRHAVNGSNISILKTTNILNCHEPRDFWVSWADDEINVGAGQHPGQQLLHYKEPLLQSFRPNAVSMATGPETSGGHWGFPIDQAEGFHVKVLSDVNSYHQFWMSILGRHSLIFSIKSCGFAKMALSSVPFETNRETYEIEIQNANGYTVIRDGIGGPYLREEGTQDLLSCTEYNTFWLKVTNKSVNFGEGPNPDHRVIFNAYHTGGTYRVASVGITMGGSSDGIWNFPRSRGNVFRAMTHNDAKYGHGWLLLNRLNVTFSVRACADARVALAGTLGDLFKDAVEIIIGSYSNTMIEIRNYIGGTVVAKARIPHLLDCEVFKPFWISWKGDTISIGHSGSMGRALLEWPFREPGSGIIPFFFRSLTFSTGSGEGEWEFDQYYEPCDNSFEKAYSIEDGLESGCQIVQISPDSIQRCKERACQMGASTINYRASGSQCRIVKCVRHDLKLRNSSTPADIYTLKTVEESYMAVTGETYAYNQHWVSVTGRQSIGFMVRACSNAHLALAAIPGNSDSMAYEIVLGGASNRRSMIRKKTGWSINPEVLLGTPHILDCSQMRFFWISWLDNQLVVGTGNKVGLEPFLVWSPEEELHIINSIGLSTAEGVRGEWLFGSLEQELPDDNDGGDTYLFETRGDTTDSYSINPAHHSMFFTLRACSDALVTVNAIQGHAQVTSFDVAIGSKINTETSIKVNGPGNIPGVTEQTPGQVNTLVTGTNISNLFVNAGPDIDVLDCNKDHIYWLRWKANDTISFGKGIVLGVNPLVALRLTGDFPDIHSIVFGTQGVQGSWGVARSMGHYFTFDTPSEGVIDGNPRFDKVWLVEENDNSLVFQVESCSKAFILLTYGINQTSGSYLVGLGSGSTYIKDGLSGDYLAIGNRYLFCGKSEWFWIRWYQGLEVGNGRQVGFETFLSTHIIYGKPIRVLSFSSGNDGNTVVWNIPDIASDTFYVSTQPQEEVFRDVWVYSSSGHVELEVKACPTANIYLGHELASDEWDKSSAFVISLSDGNSTITKYPLSSNSTIYRSRTPLLVHCHRFTTITVEWTESSITVLKGGGNQRRSVMYVFVDNMIPVNTVSLGTPASAESQSDWKFSRRMGKGTLITTQKGDSTYSKWLSVGGEEKSLVFKLKCSTDVHIILCEFVGILAYDCYEIVINQNGGNSVIKSYIDGNVKDQMEGNFLNGDNGVYMWVSWENNLISLGLGNTVSYATMLSWDATSDTYKHPVHAIGIMTDKEDGLWDFSRVQDRYYTITTPPDTDAFSNLWLRMRDNRLPFTVQACHTATIILTEKVGDTRSQRFEFVIEKRKATIKLKDPISGDEEILDTVTRSADLLSCSDPTSYIIEWETLTNIMPITLRNGQRDIIVNAYPSTGMIIGALSFATDQEAGGWSFKENIATAITVRNTADFNKPQVSYKLASGNHMFFAVKTIGPAHVLLEEHFQTLTIYEFVIGLENNQKTGIKVKGNGGGYKSVIDTPDILDQYEFVTFWVSWSKSRVALGRGLSVDQDVIISYSDEIMTTYNVQYVSFTTSWSVSGFWEFSKYKPDQILTRLPSMFGDTTLRYTLASGQEEIIFTGIFCTGGIHIYLESDTKSQLYLLQYSLAYRTFLIFKKGVFVHMAKQYDFISCDVEQLMWLSWKDGLITIALGGPAGIKILEWLDSKPLDIHQVRFNTDLEVDLTMPRFSGSAMELIVNADDEPGPYDTFWYTLYGRTSIVFALTAPDTSTCSIMFSSTPQYSTVDGYELQMKKTSLSLYHFSSGELLDSLSEMSYFNEDYPTFFWASWEDRDLKIGSGAAVGQKQLIHTNLPPYYDLIAAGFDTDKLATWTFSQDTGNSFLIFTNEDSSFKQSWFMPTSDTFAFSVIGYQSARVAILEAADKANTKAMYLVLGSFDNTGTALYDGDNEVKTVEGKGILNPELYIDFWIQWATNSSGTYLNIGQGTVGLNPFISHTVVNAKKISFSVIGIGEDMVSSAGWKIPQEQEVMTQFVSKSSGKFEHWLTVVGRQSVVFRLKSCFSARVMLVSEVGNVLLPSTEIGIDDNGRSYIRDSNDVNNNVTKNTPDLLNCVDQIAFWIKWSNRDVQFGVGATISRGTMMTYENPNLHHIMGIGLASGANDEDKDSTWEFFRMTGNVVYERTMSDKQYYGVQILPEDPSDFTISARVRTCEEAMVSLFPLTRAQPHYTVAFGTYENTMSEILKANIRKDSALTPTMMGHHIDIPIWVRWTEGKDLTAGLGGYPGHPILKFLDPDPASLNGVGFTSGSPKCDALWAIDMNYGDMIFMETPGTFSGSPTSVSILDIHELSFRLKAKHAAHIALSVIPGHLHTFTYEIVLQELVTGNSDIRDEVGGKKLASAHTPGLLSETEFRSFWITWNRKIIQFGTGEKHSVDTRLLYYDGEEIPPFAMLTFASYASASASWEINVGGFTGPTTTTTTTTSTSTTASTSTETTTSSTVSTISTTTSTKSTSSTKPTSPGNVVTTPPDEGDQDPGNLSAGEVVGIVFGGLVAALLIVFVVLFILVKVRTKPSDEMTALNDLHTNPAYNAEDIGLPFEDDKSALT